MISIKNPFSLTLFFLICVFSLSKVQSQRNPSDDLPVLGLFTQNLTLSWDSNVGCSEYEGKETEVSFEEISMNDCITVCGNSIINYSILGQIPNGIDVTWQVNGGIANTLFNNGQSVEVEWSNSGSGLITVELTASDGEVFTKSQCITIIEAPESRIELLPFQDISICLNDTVQFLNESFDNNDSELILYEWVFTGPNGDIIYSTEFEPNFQFNIPGDWKVEMRTTNACGCVSSFDELSLNVSETQALTIDCPTVICENETMEYSVNGYEECGEFEWQVQGGDIRSIYENTITIDWNSPGETVDGFGIISFNQSNCGGECTGWITERIPIILNNGDNVFSGPDEICLGVQKLFSMPQWPTTSFTWTLETLGGSSISDDYLLQPDQRNEIVVETAANNTPLAAGQYVLKVDYFNTLLECDGIASKIITISDKTIILPTTNFCVNDRILVETTDPSSGTIWEVYFGNNAPLTVQDDQFTQALSNAGTYTVIAQNPGKCKSDPVQVKILRLPNQPSGSINIVRSDPLVQNPRVCPNIPLELNFENTDPNSYIEWRFPRSSDGVIQGNNSGETITISFADLSNLPQSNYLVEIRRVLRDPASCEGPWKRYSFLPISIDNEINGFGITPVDQEIFCTSSTAYFEATYVEGEYYTWSVVPDNLGSVVAGQGTRFPTVEWNEIPDGYVFNPLDGLRVSIRKCGIEYLESQYPITLTDDPNLRFVNLPTDICANNIFDVSFTSDIDFDSFNSVATSLFLDGQLIRNATTVLNGNIVTIRGASFNPTNVDYIGEIRLVIIDPSGCNGGVLEEKVNVRANPSVDLILTNEPDNYCNTPWIVTLDTQVQGNSSSLFFRWYDENGTLINSGLGLDSIDVTSSSGSSSYTVEVESPNNCIAMDDVQLPFCAPIPPCPNPVPESVLSNVSWSSCNQITATASFDPSVINYSWSIIGSSTAVVLPSSTASSGFFSFNELGNYTIVYEVEYPNGCRDQQAERITVGYQSVLDVNPSCAGNNSYNVQLLNSSPFLIAYQPTSVTYTGRNTSTGGAVFNIPGNLAEANLSNLTPGIYEFNLTIDAPNGPPCSLPDPVIVDLRLPDATFSIDDTCTENAINLSPNDPQREGYTYRWEFNNTANENYQVDVVLPQMLDTSVKLIVTDPYGCSNESDVNDPNTRIDVNAATFFGTIEGDGDYCHTDSPILFYQDNNPIVPDPVVLQWFAYGDDVLDSTNSLQPLATGATYSPIISGNYYARAYDIDGCYVELAPALINITQPYSISIPDQGQICSNDDYFLQGFIDASLDDVEYRWTQRTVGSASPPVEILGWTSDAPVGVTINESTAAYYSFTLEVRRKNTTCVTGAASSMYVTDPPVTTLSVSYNCDPNNPYEVELTASNPSSYIDSFLWSDGQMGETIRVNRGGAYQVTSLSTYYNCPIIANVEVRKHPDEFIWVFPSGCYEFCPESIQGEILGPLPDFQEWSWSNDPIGIESGNNSSTDVYDMDVVINNSFIESSLLLYLENLGGCFIESEPLIIIRNNELCNETSERNSLKTGVLKIIPNPTNDRTKIAWEEIEINEKDLFIRVYSLQGVLLVDKKVSPQWSEVEFNASKLKTGTYLVRLEDGFTTYLTGQLIKK